MTDVRQQEKQDRIVSARVYDKNDLSFSRSQPTMIKSSLSFMVLLAVAVLAMVVHAGEDGVVCIESDGQQQQNGCVSSDDMAVDGSGIESVVSEKEIGS